MNLKTKILSELLDAEQFDRVLALLKCYRVLLFFKYSLLYIEVWNMNVMSASTSKKSRLLKL